MPGFQSVAKKSSALSLVQTDQFRMTLVCISVGIFSGLFIACVKLNLGLSGHKAFLWMTPLLIARFRTGAKIGTAAGGLFAAMTAYSLGANLAGGLIGFPLIAVAGGVLDAVANYIEKNKVSLFSMILMLAFAGALANLICLFKRMFGAAGISPHNLLGAGMGVRALFYVFFGSLSGIVAAIAVKTVGCLKGRDKD